MKDFQLCNDEGLVSGEYLTLHNNLASHTGHPPVLEPFQCTGSAHLAGEHFKCTSPAHEVPEQEFFGDAQIDQPACARKGCGRPWSEHEYGMFCP